MNFFESQDKARKSTRWLVLIFIVAVLAIVVVIDLALLFAFGFANVQLQPDGSWFAAMKAGGKCPFADRRCDCNSLSDWSGQSV